MNAHLCKRLASTALLVSIALLVGCSALHGAKPVDLSTPQTAAVAYLNAIRTADAPTARSACVGTGNEMRWVDATVAMVDGMRKLNDAIYARFGRITLAIHNDLEESLHELADEPVVRMENGSVQANETQATVTPRRTDFRGRFQPALQMKKVGTTWKVNLAETYVPLPPHQQLLNMSATDREQYFKDANAKVSEGFVQYHRAADVFHDVAGDVRAGRYKTPEAIEKDLAVRIAAASP
jgi:hypothetical protein